MKQYIDKAAVVGKIIDWKIHTLACGYPGEGDFEWGNKTGRLDTCEEILSFLDTLDVKEVDLDNEYIEEVYSHLDNIKDTADRMTSGNFMHNIAAVKFSANTIVKVLELIGLKAQKGE